MIFEIWLGEHWSHFECGLAHLEDGSTQELRACIHSSTYGRDTVLVDTQERYKEMHFPVRGYVEENGLSFYCWDEEITAILFHNDSGKDLTLDRYGVLLDGETKRLERA